VRYRRDDNVMLRRIAGETLLVPIRGRLVDLRQVFVLEGIGDFVWELLDGPRTVEQITHAVAGEFEVTPQTAAEDTAALLRQMREAGLVAEVD
jgi:hypothetical protein